MRGEKAKKYLSEGNSGDIKRHLIGGEIRGGGIHGEVVSPWSKSRVEIDVVQGGRIP